MGLKQKIIQQIRRRFQLPAGEDRRGKTHGDCARFDDGVCLASPRFLNLTNLNPKAQACPHFESIKIAKNKSIN